MINTVTLLDYQIIKYDKFVFHIKNTIFYSTSHLWFDFKEDYCFIGITDYLQQTIGDIAFVSVFFIHEQVTPNQKVLEIETMKINLELSLPFSGTIIEKNSYLENDPHLVSKDPYGDGWILRLESFNMEEVKKHLMTADEYTGLIRGEVEKFT